MRPAINVITLAVSDLDRALEFYREGLGLDSPGVIGSEYTGDDTSPAGAAAMFELEGDLTLALYPRAELAKDAGVPLGPPTSGEFSIGHRRGLWQTGQVTGKMLGQQASWPSQHSRTMSGGQHIG